jgi:hypothetical protein
VAADNCLVVHRGSESNEESLLRVATLSDLTTPLPSLPGTVEQFSSASIAPLVPAGLQVGDIITVYDVPALWQYFFNVVDGATFTVDSISAPFTPFIVKVTPEFPAFARNLRFTVSRGGPLIIGAVSPWPIDGVANRYYSYGSPLDSLTNVHYDSWDDIDSAENKFTSLRGEAQALVDALNIDNYTGILEELYT